MTRQDNFLKLYPKALLKDGVINICPGKLDGDLNRFCYDYNDCQECRNKYWLEKEDYPITTPCYITAQTTAKYVKPDELQMIQDILNNYNYNPLLESINATILNLCDPVSKEEEKK